MTERYEPTLEVTCVVCGRPMTFLRTIGRAFADEVNVFECMPCRFSITQSRMVLMKQRKFENRIDQAAAEVYRRS